MENRNLVSTLRLTRLRRGDLSRVVDIERACFPHPWSEQSLKEVIEGNVFTSLGTRTRTHTLVGYIIFSEVADELHILNLAIVGKYRRLHVATWMLQQVHEESLKRGRVHAYLEVRESNWIARKLYEGFGYRPIAKRRNYYVDENEDAVLMGLNLSKPA